MKNLHAEVSVIMPVYNNERFISQAIESILTQTLENLELIVIDDASSDNTLPIIKHFKDKRVRVVENKINLGNYRSRNIGLDLAKGRYICVMDSDDVSLPERLGVQIAFLEENKEYALIGSSHEWINDRNVVLGKSIRMRDFDNIIVFLLKDNCFCHPTIMMRKEMIDRARLRYDEQYYYSSDYDFIVRVAEKYKVTNLHECLVQYRLHNGQITVKQRKDQMHYADKIRISQVARFKVKPRKDEIDIHNRIMKGAKVSESEFDLAISWFNKLINRNAKLNLYNSSCLESFFRTILQRSAKQIVYDR